MYLDISRSVLLMPFCVIGVQHESDILNIVGVEAVVNICGTNSYGVDIYALGLRKARETELGGFGRVYHALGAADCLGFSEFATFQVYDGKFSLRGDQARAIGGADHGIYIQLGAGAFCYEAFNGELLAPCGLPDKMNAVFYHEPHGIVFFDGCDPIDSQFAHQFRNRIFNYAVGGK